MSSLVRAGFWRAGCTVHQWQGACQKAMYDKSSYQTCRTKRTCRNAERPHTDTIPKQPRPRRAGEIKSRRAAPRRQRRAAKRTAARGGGPTTKGRLGGHQIKTQAASAGSGGPDGPPGAAARARRRTALCGTCHNRLKI
jgi:hypothetical protein